MNDEVEQLKNRVAQLEDILFKFVRNDRYLFSKDIAHTSKKLGFFGTTPSDQYDVFYTSGSVSSGATLNAGGTFTINSTLGGSLGTTEYFLPDIVRALKEKGILKL